jgi:hypothetical protein
VTPRAWKTLALGAVVVAAAAGFAASQGRSSSSTSAQAHWGLYSSAEWNVVAASFARRGFAFESVRIVTGAGLANGQPFALLGARSNTGRTCFALARGTVLGTTICSIRKPFVVFSAPGRTIIGLVRRDVTATMISRGRESGLVVVPAGPGYAFNLTPVHPGDRLRARNAAGRVLASLTFGAR